jgi:hypothetical protein
MIVRLDECLVRRAFINVAQAAMLLLLIPRVSAADEIHYDAINYRASGVNICRLRLGGRLIPRPRFKQEFFVKILNVEPRAGAGDACLSELILGGLTPIDHCISRLPVMLRHSVAITDRTVIEFAIGRQTISEVAVQESGASGDFSACLVQCINQTKGPAARTVEIPIVVRAEVTYQRKLASRTE